MTGRRADLTICCEYLRTGRRSPVIARVYRGLLVWADRDGPHHLDLRDVDPGEWERGDGILEGLLVPCRCGAGGHHPAEEWATLRGVAFVVE